MPKRDDIKTILLIGSGPIVIGQACEFDYSGTQAAKTLKELGYKVVLINSNPATIMTDPEFADRTYIEPITEEIVADIIKKEKVDAIAIQIFPRIFLRFMACHGSYRMLTESPVIVQIGLERRTKSVSRIT